MKPAKMNFITKLGIKHAGIDSLVKSFCCTLCFTFDWTN